MSATNRGSKRRAADLYPTPLSAFEPLLPYIPRGFTVWEPACGDERLIFSLRDAGFNAYGNDLTKGYDFLKDNRDYPTIVTNPPYSWSFEFVKHAVEHADYVFMLLRLNFLASEKRKTWFRFNEPRTLFVLSNRPSFVNGGTDATDYAWFFWTRIQMPLSYPHIIHL